MEKEKYLTIGEMCDLDNKKECLHISDEFLVDLVKFMRSKKYIKAKCRIERIDYGCEFTSNNLKNRIEVPILMFDNTRRESINKIFDFINKEYKFNIVEYAKENNINIKVACLLFVLMHEFAHNHLNWEREYMGLGASHYNFIYKNEYLRVRNNCMNVSNDELDILYRRIPPEKYADKKAIQWMKRHRRALMNIVKKHKDELVCVDMTDEDNKELFYYSFREYTYKY